MCKNQKASFFGSTNVDVILRAVPTLYIVTTVNYVSFTHISLCNSPAVAAFLFGKTGIFTVSKQHNSTLFWMETF